MGVSGDMTGHMRAAGGGEGKLDYLVPGVLGFMTGAGLFAATVEGRIPQDQRAGESGQHDSARVVEFEQRFDGARVYRIHLVLFLFAGAAVIWSTGGQDDTLT